MTSTRCFQCFRPRDLCYCRQLPRIHNQTDVLLLQHRVEARHRFNTARMVAAALQRCQRWHGFSTDFQQAAPHLHNQSALLYPGPQAQNLADLPVSQRPTQLVIVDGTWHHAKTMRRDTPWLRQLPQVTLPAASPGRYQIRREPTAASLSTVEATVRALQILEPNTQGLDGL